MGTRSLIIVTGHGRHGTTVGFRLYKHWDGYPTGNLPVIEKALELSQRFMRQNDGKLSAETLVGMLIGAATDEHGMGAKLEWSGSRDAAFEIDHGDLEWIYCVDTADMTLEIFGGDIGNRTKDPMDYVKQLRTECQDSERHATDESVRMIESWGVSVNQDRKKTKGKGK